MRRFSLLGVVVIVRSPRQDDKLGFEAVDDSPAILGR
jgi:hypothetical protein